MSDIVRVPCPHCKHVTQVSSDAGDNKFGCYTSHDVPIEIAEDISTVSYYHECDHCRGLFCIKADMPTHVSVRTVPK